MSSPYLCVCGDDHVTCYMGADVDEGEQADAWDGVGTPWELLLILACQNMVLL